MSAMTIATFQEAKRLVTTSLSDAEDKTLNPLRAQLALLFVAAELEEYEASLEGMRGPAKITPTGRATLALAEQIILQKGL